jgi:hypothetical protein
MPRRVPKRKPKTVRAHARKPAPVSDLATLLATPEFQAMLDEEPPVDDPDDPRIDPELMLDALSDLARDAAKQGQADAMVSGARAYAVFYGYDDANPVPPESVPKMAELIRRVSAVADLLPDLGLPSDPNLLPSLAAAACTVALGGSASRPTFERDAFLAAFERAGTARGA